MVERLGVTLRYETLAEGLAASVPPHETVQTTF
jgi:hypothetical protein